MLTDSLSPSYSTAAAAFKNYNKGRETTNKPQHHRVVSSLPLYTTHNLTDTQQKENIDYQLVQYSNSYYSRRNFLLSEQGQYHTCNSVTTSVTSSITCHTASFDSNTYPLICLQFQVTAAAYNLGFSARVQQKQTGRPNIQQCTQ